MMRWNWKTVLTVMVWLAWAAAPSALRADPLNVAVTQSSQTVTQGTLVVTFDATITNPSPTDTIWLNSDDSTTLSLLTALTIRRLT
jgi:inosine-uridine nucleoside N-ribohydrolase